MIRLERSLHGIDIVGIDLPPSADVESTSDEDYACNAVFSGRCVDYIATPNIIARIVDLRRAFDAYYCPWHYFDGCSDADRILLNFGHKMLSGIVDLRVPCTPRILEALTEPSVVGSAIQDITIGADGYVPFLQYICDNELQCGDKLSIHISWKLPYAVPIRANELCISTICPDNVDYVKETVRTAVVDGLYLCTGHMRVVFENACATHVTVDGCFFASAVPQMRSLTLIGRGFGTPMELQLEQCPRLVQIHGVFTLAELKMLLEQVPMLNWIPSVSCSVPRGEVRALLLLHAPHLLEMHDSFPDSNFRWAPKLHPRFSCSGLPSVLEAFVFGAERLCNDGRIAAYDPAVLEEILRVYSYRDRDMVFDTDD